MCERRRNWATIFLCWQTGKKWRNLNFKSKLFFLSLGLSRQPNLIRLRIVFKTLPLLLFPSFRLSRSSDGKKNTSLMTCSDEAQPAGRHATTTTKSNLGPSVNLFPLSLCHVYSRRWAQPTIFRYATCAQRRDFGRFLHHWQYNVLKGNESFLLSRSIVVQLCDLPLLLYTSCQLLLRWGGKGVKGPWSVGQTLSDIHAYDGEGVYTTDFTTCTVLCFYTGTVTQPEKKKKGKTGELSRGIGGKIKRQDTVYKEYKEPMRYWSAVELLGWSG